jgi:hypothetical protein
MGIACKKRAYTHSTTLGNHLLQKMQGKAAYVRPKVVRLFPGHCANGSYVQ